MGAEIILLFLEQSVKDWVLNLILEIPLSIDKVKAFHDFFICFVNKKENDCKWIWRISFVICIDGS